MATDYCIIVSTANGFVDVIRQAARAAANAYECIEVAPERMTAEATRLRERAGLVIIDAVNNPTVLPGVLRVMTSHLLAAGFSAIVVHGRGARPEELLRGVPAMDATCVIATIAWGDASGVAVELCSVLRQQARNIELQRTRELVQRADPFVEEDVVCLFADLEGYTVEVSDEDARRLRAGEPLPSWRTEFGVLRLMSEIAKRIEDQGGEVRGFAGDSIQAVFRPLGNAGRNAVLSAMSAAQNMEYIARNDEELSRSGPSVLHVGIDCGSVIWINQPAQVVSGPREPLTSRPDDRAIVTSLRMPAGLTVIRAYRFANVRPHELAKLPSVDEDHAISAVLAEPQFRQRGLILLPEKTFALHCPGQQRLWVELDADSRPLPAFSVDIQGFGKVPMLLIRRIP